MVLNDCFVPKADVHICPYFLSRYKKSPTIVEAFPCVTPLYAFLILYENPGPARPSRLQFLTQSQSAHVKKKQGETCKNL